MKDDIEKALRTIDEDYIECFKMIRKVYEYLDTVGLQEFNRYSRYRWSNDRDKKKGYAYICIRYGSSLSRKVIVKRRALIEDADLHRWVENKDLIEEAMEEAYQYIYAKVNAVKNKIEDLKSTMEDYKGKFDGISKDYDEIQAAKKDIKWEEESPAPHEGDKRHTQPAEGAVEYHTVHARPAGNHGA